MLSLSPPITQWPTQRISLRTRTSMSWPRKSPQWVSGLHDCVVRIVQKRYWLGAWQTATAACAIYLTASGLWYSALLIDAMPTLIICIRSFETSVLSNALLGFRNGGQALFYYVSIASIVFTEDITQSGSISSTVSCLPLVPRKRALAGCLVDAYGV